MKEKLKEKIEEIKKEIPKELKESINSFNWEEVVQKIGEENSLTENEINDLFLETALILTGIEYGDIFSLNIENEVGTTKEKAEKISKEIDKKVFEPIYKKIEEKIKAELKEKKPKWKQNINFVLSNGDWTTFLDPFETINKNTETPAPKIDIDFITKKTNTKK
ncbi:MAG: hypothetical protein WC898_03530 [Candidatus Paceibacterota bacterium]|jgi:hypothetical protein